MISVMKKVLGSAAAAASYLMLASQAFAQISVTIAPPLGSVPDTVKVENLPGFIIQLLFIVGVIAAIAYLIYGGIRWVMSGGDKAGVESARNHIVAAIVGLIIIAAAYFIINLVFTLLTGDKFDLNHICIPTLANPRCK